MKIADLRLREAFLDHVCGTNVSLRQEVEGLLQAQKAPAGFFPEHPSEGQALGPLFAVIESITESANGPSLRLPDARIGR